MLSYRTLRSTLVLALGVMLSTLGWSQAAAEYGTILSKSTAGAAGMGSSVGKVVNRAAGGMRVTTSGSRSMQVVGPTGKAGGRALEASMQANRQALETAAGEKGAMLSIGTEPSQTKVIIDGALVAYAPAEIRMPAGKHTIELFHPAFFPWKQEMTMSSGEKVRLEPKLVRDQHVAYVSF